MRFATLRKLLFQLHMWIGLGLGLLLVALGLSGSVLVYDDAIAKFLAPAPRATAQGAALPLDRIIAAARASTAVHGPATVTPPGGAGEAALVRIGAAGRGGAGRAPATQVYVDPVSGAVLGSGPAGLPPVLAFAHQLHGNFLMAQPGRRFVGWLGLAMVLLGISGLVLWWPKRGQWKYAFTVRRGATGLRFHRELHGMMGIWMYAVFIAVSFSGVALAWPQLMGVPNMGANARPAPVIAPPGGAARIGADQAVTLVRAAVPDMALRTVMVPERAGQPITVSFFSHGAVNATAYVDPLRARVIEIRDPSASVMAWQRPLHQGLLGPVWRFLVFASGLLPAIFVFTGAAMWLKKRRSRMAMNAPLVLEPAE
jgi:uncharacterized iron-regulated membrane protein